MNLKLQVTWNLKDATVHLERTLELPYSGLRLVVDGLLYDVATVGDGDTCVQLQPATSNQTLEEAKGRLLAGWEIKSPAESGHRDGVEVRCEPPQ